MSSKKHKKGKSKSAQRPAAQAPKTADKVISGLTCAECEAMLSDYMLDLTSPEDTEKIKSHLASCPQCSAALEEFELIESKLSGAAFVEPPPDFMQSLHKRLVKEQPVRLRILGKFSLILDKLSHVSEKLLGIFGAIGSLLGRGAAKLKPVFAKATPLFAKAKTYIINIRKRLVSKAAPVMRDLADRYLRMPKVWRAGAPVLMCVLLVAVISTGVVSHTRKISSGGADTQLVSNLDSAQQYKNTSGQSDNVTDRTQNKENTDVDNPEASPSAEPQPDQIRGEEPKSDLNGNAASEQGADIDNSFAQNTGGHDIPMIEYEDETVDAAPDSGAAVTSGAGGGDAFSGGYAAKRSAAYTVDSEPAPMSAEVAADMPVHSGTMDVYIIRTSNISQTLANSGFANKAIRENGKTVLILTRSEYSRLQANLISADMNEEIGYSGSRSVNNSYEWDGCFRVEIVGR